METSPIIGHIDWDVTVGATGEVIAGSQLDVTLDRVEITTQRSTQGVQNMMEITKDLRQEFSGDKIGSPEAMAAMTERLKSMQGGMAALKEPVGPSWFTKTIRLDTDYSLLLNEHPEEEEKSGFSLSPKLASQKIFSFEPFEIEDGVARPLKFEGRILCQTARTPHGTELSRLTFESDIHFRMFVFDPINPPNIRKLPHPDWLLTIRAGSDITWPYLESGSDLPIVP